MGLLGCVVTGSGDGVAGFHIKSEPGPADVTLLVATGMTGDALAVFADLPTVVVIKLYGGATATAGNVSVHAHLFGILGLSLSPGKIFPSIQMLH